MERSSFDLSSTNELRAVRLEHAQSLEAAGINIYPGEPPVISHTNTQIKAEFNRLEGGQVSVVGRIVAKRDHGKTVFYDIEDENEKLQIVHSRTEENEDQFKLVSENFDTGDFVNVRGTVFKTKRGEISVKGEQIDMLAKALLPPPSDKLAVTDPEIARKRRYLELMASPEARERFRMRARMVQIMREEFLSRHYLEVETPILDNTYGGAIAKPFETHFNALGQNMYLRIANELYLKRLVVGNMGPVFEFSRDFRNEGMDRTHNPEFTQVELYKPYADYSTMMEMAENVFEHVAIDLHGTTKVKFGDDLIDFKTPWRRLTVLDGLKDAYGFEPEVISNADLISLRDQEGVSKKHEGRDDILLALFEHKHDGTLIQPTFVLDFPKGTSPLTKIHRNNPNLVERFETYVGGFEVMNCYTELNDPRDQRDRFDSQVEKRLGGDDEAMQMDEDFITAMEYGMPPMGGIGISIDRMAMIMTNTNHIRDIILFPPVRDRK